MTKNILTIQNLHVTADKKQILKGLNLTIKSGEIHALMGPNGSGKSTLLNTIMGHPGYKITKGKILFNNKDISKLSPDKRAKLGIFLGQQHPSEIQGVNITTFLRQAKNSNSKKHIGPMEFLNFAKTKTKTLKLKDDFLERDVNVGFSGGEKKKSEIFQMAILEPKIAVLDEIDSGLDIDALKTTARTVSEINKKTSSGILLVTHYARILKYIVPEFVHIIENGKITKSGGIKLAHELEKKGYGKNL